MTPAFQVTIAEDGIATLTFDLPGEKVNKFTPEVLDELEKHLDELKHNSNIKALKLTSGKEGIFIAGADLHSFEPAFEKPELAENIIRRGHTVFSKLEGLPFPTIAIINGVCLGGGLECALSCTYRIVSDHPKTLLGLPEVSLGIIPGWGGTQRLPRLVGLREGLTMIVSAKVIPAMKAYKIHLADAIAAWEFFPEKADEFVRYVLTEKGQNEVEQRRKPGGLGYYLLEANAAGRALVFWQAKKSILEKTKNRYPAPLIALDVVQKSYTMPLEEGLREEADRFVGGIPNGFQLAKDLIGLFFTQEAAKKEPPQAQGAKPRKVNYAAILGAGTMGAGMAWLFSSNGVHTRLKDLNWELIGKGIGVARGLYEKGVKAKKVTPCKLDRGFNLISGTIDYSGFNHVDIVVEAATENLELKQKIFQEVEEAVKDDAIIASNTSSLTIAEMSAGMQHPERFIGMHFFNPVHKMPLVEIVPGEHTTPEVIATTFDFCKKMGKTPMVVGDCAGFLVNRIFLAGANEVILMLEEGYSKDTLEKTLLDFGMPMGPFALADEVGNDVTYKVCKSLEKAYGARMKAAKLVELMSEKGLTGRKSGQGFYLYKGKNMKWNSEVDRLVREVGRRQSHLPEENILPRFLYVMINEASRCLEEQIIDRADFVDLALITGTGFPPFRGGLLRYADKIGIQNVVETLKRFEQEFGPRFAPSSLLEQMAQDNRSFYQ